MEHIKHCIDMELESLDTFLKNGGQLSTVRLGILKDLLTVQMYCDNEYPEHNKDVVFSTEVAKQWVAHMTGGEHWSWEECMGAKRDYGVAASDAVVYAVLNMLYSDYNDVFSKHNVNTMNFYVDMLNAWIHDSDAPKDKTERYYSCVIDSHTQK